MGRYFGTDGIRGQANSVLTNEIAFKVGRFIGDYYKKNGKGKIVLAMDTRLSSKMFESILTSAIISSGSDVYQLGYASTPCLAYIAGNKDFDCGVMISASHNPFDDNGIKIFGNNGLKIGDEFENLIENYIDNPEGIEYALKENIGRVIDYEYAIKEYQDWLIASYPTKFSDLRVVVDLANGASCYTAKEVLNKTGLNVDFINDNPDGININTNCGSTHLENLKEEVIKGKYALGFAFDGDADRVKFVDKEGREVSGDKIMYLLAKYLKDNNKLTNNTLVTTVMSNIGLFKALDKNNIAYDVTAVGDKNVADSMILNDFVIGGEESGHIICRLDSNFGDGLKTALLVLEAINHYKKDLIELTDELTIYPQLLINVKVKDKEIVLNDDEINKVIKNIEEELGKDGRILVRPSGTEPLIRVMVEAESNELCHQYTSRVVDLINSKGYAQA